MTARLSITGLLAISLLSLITIAGPAAADDSCSSPYVWGRNSYFGDRWEYSHRHAYPEHTYRSSRHFIYYRRVPHFYSSSSSYRYTSNFYCSPEYRAYYTYGPYIEPTRYYDPQRYSSPATRPYVPFCADDENIGDTYPPYYDYERNRIENRDDAQRDGETIYQRSPVDDAHKKADLYLSKAAEQALDRGWDLLRDSKPGDAMPVFAEAAMLRGADALPRLAYGLAAAIDGQDVVAAWAIRRAINADSQILTRIPADPAIRQQLVDALAERIAKQDVANASADEANNTIAHRRDALVIETTLAVLVENAEAMKTALTALAQLEDQNTARAVAVASKAFVAQRWSGDTETENNALAANDE